MSLWEDAFKKKGRDTSSSCSASEGTSSGTKRTAGNHESRMHIDERDRTHFYRRNSNELTIRSYPPILKKLRSSLDDLWSNILLETKERPDTLFVCAATPGEGSTFTSFHLALFLALEANMKTLYVDTNFQFSENHSIIPRIQEYPGLTSFFMDNQPLSPLVLRTEYDNLFVLPSGFSKNRDFAGNSMFQKESLESLINFCRSNFDITIFDGQPIVSNPRMVELAKAVNHVILICRYGQSRREVSKLAIDKLRKNAVSIIGIVLNDRQYPIPASIYNTLK